MADITEKPKPIDRTGAWIDRELIRKAKFVGDKTDETLAEVIERHARAGIDREYARLIAREHAEIGGEA